MDKSGKDTVTRAVGAGLRTRPATACPEWCHCWHHLNISGPASHKPNLRPLYIDPDVPHFLDRVLPLTFIPTWDHTLGLAPSSQTASSSCPSSIRNCRGPRTPDQTPVLTHDCNLPHAMCYGLHCTRSTVMYRMYSTGTYVAQTSSRFQKVHPSNIQL